MQTIKGLEATIDGYASDKNMITFFDRLNTILSTRSNSRWSELINVSKSLPRTRWRQGSFPRGDNLIKILEVSGFSANWLMHGIGPKYMQDVFDPDDIKAKEKDRRNIYDYIIKLEHQIDKYNALINHLDALKALKWLFEDENGDLWSKSVNDIEHMSAKQIFTKIIVPFATVFLRFNLIAFKFLELISQSDKGNQKIKSIVETMHHDLDKNKYDTMSMLKDLDKLFANDLFMDLVEAITCSD